VVTDADAGLAMQAGVAARIGALHEEDPAAIAHDDIRNELLVGRVFLGYPTVEVSAVSRYRFTERR
jgi:hypothetical protein